MEQLYYTSCKTGFSVDGAGGLRFRAVSIGLPLHLAKEFSNRLGYTLPSHDFTVSNAPIRLAFLPVNSGETLLVHSNYLGEDPDTGRQGNYFSHAILVTPEITSREAIRTWDSSEWKQENADYESSLPLRDHLPRETTFSGPACAKVADFAAYPENCANLEWTMNAIVNTPGQFDQVIIIGDSHYIAWLIYCALHVLPTPLSRKIKFSTYEKNPLTASAAVVGTVFPDGIEAPSSFFRDGKAALDTRSGKRTEVPTSGYAEMILRGLTAGDHFDIFSLVAALDQYGEIEATDLNLIADFLLGKIEDPVKVSRLLDTLSPDIWLLILNLEEQWNRVVNSVFELKEINSGVYNIFAAAPVFAKNAIHEQSFNRIGDSIRADRVDRIDKIIKMVLPLSGYPITSDWLAQLDAMKGCASMECRRYIYSWLVSLPDHRSEAESWLQSAPLAQIQQLYQNSWSPKPKEFTPAILAQTLLQPVTIDPAEVGRLIPKVGHEIIPLIIEKIDVWSGPGDSKKTDIVQELIDSARSKGLKTDALALPATGPGAQNLQLSALLRIDPRLALAVWRKLSQEKTLLSAEVVNALHEIESRESGVMLSVAFPMKAPVVTLGKTITHAADPVSGMRQTLSPLTFEVSDMANVESFVDLARKFDIPVLEIAKEVA
jgi:hypothetical protein